MAAFQFPSRAKIAGGGKRKRSLLLLDDNERILKILSLHMKRRFDEIFVVTDPAQAEEILEKNEVSTVVCDHGSATPSGVELIARWRSRYGFIKRAVILTGADAESIEPAPEVDKVLSKSMPMSDILTEIGR